MAGIDLHALSKTYPGGVRAVDSLDLSIVDGEFFALLGPSGCGKTTLLRTIAGLELATGGQVHIGGRDVTGLQPGKRDIAMVFQDYALFPHMTVVDNIAYPLRVRRVGLTERRGRAEETGNSLSLEGLMHRRPGELSGGQQQRVALARAIACQPQVFLFDEPLSNLDARLRLEARTFLKRLQRELGVTTVFVTHDQAEALALADRMAVMEKGQIRQLGTPTEVFQRPANLFVANFIGSTPMNLLAGRVTGGAVQVGGIRLPLPAAISRAGAGAETGAPADALADALADGENVVYGVRPEYCAFSDQPREGGLAGTVAIVENLGTSYLVSLEVGDVSVQLTVPEGSEPDVGSQGWAVPQPDRVLVYRAADGELVAAGAASPADARS